MKVAELSYDSRIECGAIRVEGGICRNRATEFAIIDAGFFRESTYKATLLCKTCLKELCIEGDTYELMEHVHKSNIDSVKGWRFI